MLVMAVRSIMGCPSCLPLQAAGLTIVHDSRLKSLTLHRTAGQASLITRQGLLRDPDHIVPMLPRIGHLRLLVRRVVCDLSCVRGLLTPEQDTA